MFLSHLIQKKFSFDIGKTLCHDIVTNFYPPYPPKTSRISLNFWNINLILSSLSLKVIRNMWLKNEKECTS